MRLSFFAAVVALSLPLAAAAEAQRWHRIEEPDFNAEFPGQPKLEQAQAQTEIGPTATASWDWATADESTYFSLSYTQYAAGAMAAVKPREILDKARDAALEASEAKATLSKSITVAVGGEKFPGLEYEGLTPEGVKVSSRLYLVNDRMYQLINVRPAAAARDADFRQFTQAFEIKRVSAGLDPDAPVAEAAPAPAAGGEAPRVKGHHQPSPKKRKK